MELPAWIADGLKAGAIEGAEARLLIAMLTEGIVRGGRCYWLGDLHTLPGAPTRNSLYGQSRGDKRTRGLIDRMLETGHLRRDMDGETRCWSIPLVTGESQVTSHGDPAGFPGEQPPDSARLAPRAPTSYSSSPSAPSPPSAASLPTSHVNTTLERILQLEGVFRPADQLQRFKTAKVAHAVRALFEADCRGEHKESRAGYLMACMLNQTVEPVITSWEFLARWETQPEADGLVPFRRPAR